MRLSGLRALLVCAGVQACTSAGCTDSSPLPQPPPPVAAAPKPAAASLSETSLNFGSVDCGTEAPKKELTIRNTGGEPLSYKADVQPPGAFALVGSTDGTIPAGGSAKVTVSAAAIPASATAGTVSTAALLLTTSDAAKASTSLPLTITAAGATFALTPAAADFGEFPVNAQAPAISWTLENTGNKAATVTFGALPSADFGLEYSGYPTPAAVKAHAKLSGKALFRASGIGVKGGDVPLSVSGATCGQSVKQLSIKGFGTSGVIGVSPGTLDFGRVDCGTTGVALSFTVANTGNFAATWSVTAGKRASSPYIVSPSSGILPPNTLTTVTVTPKPIPQTSALTDNFYGDTLTVTSNAPGDAPKTVTLLEGAQGAILAFAAPTASFPNGRLGGVAQTTGVTLHNTGNVAANVTLATTAAPTFRITPATETPVAPGGQLDASLVFNMPMAMATVRDVVSVSTSTAVCSPLPSAVAVTGVVSGIATPTMISTGGNFNRGTFNPSSCIVLGEGNVACWGSNNFGQLGDGTLVPRGRPALTVGIEHATRVVSAQDHNCALTSDGAVYCWGGNERGQIGDGANGNQPTPVSMIATGATAIAADHRETCAIADGLVKCWGSRGMGRGGARYMVPTTQDFPVATYTEVAAAGGSVCALTSAGDVYCAGVNGRGQLGSGELRDSFSLTANQVLDVANAVAIEGGAAGNRSGTFCAVINDGTVKCWGDGNACKNGAAADSCGTDVRMTRGTVIPGLSSVAAIAVGASHACALTSAKEVLCWGNNVLGQLGRGTIGQRRANPNWGAPPAVVPGITDVSAIGAGGSRTCALDGAGKAHCWGGGSASPVLVTGF